MRIFSTLLVACLLSIGSIKAQTGEAVQEILGAPDLKSASLGMYAVNLNSGEVLIDHGHQLSLVPASIMKVLTTSAVVDRLGADYRFTTTLGFTGEVEGNTLRGDLVVVGEADPSLGHKNLKGTDPIAGWVNALKELGIEEVTGELIAVDTLFGDVQIPSTWVWEDMGNYYATGSSGLSYKGNEVELKFSTGSVGSRATLLEGGYPAGLAFESLVTASSDPRDMAYIYGAPGMNERQIRGTLPANNDSYTINGSVPNPLAFSAYRLKKDFEAGGISIKGESKTSDTLPGRFKLIAEHQSPALGRLVEYTNHESDNLFAEHLLRMLAVEAGQPGDYDHALPHLKAFFEMNGIETRGFYPADGSGLSRFNGVTAQQLGRVLQIMWESEYREVFKNSLPVIGEEGSLKYVGKGTPAEGRGWAKSGYMERVRSYAGYLERQDGNVIAFALIANNFDCTPSEMRRKWSRIIGALAE